MENFHKSHESIAIRKNFVLEIFARNIKTISMLLTICKIIPSQEVGIGQLVGIFPLENNLLYK